MDSLCFSKNSFTSPRLGATLSVSRLSRVMMDFDIASHFPGSSSFLFFICVMDCMTVDKMLLVVARELALLGKGMDGLLSLVILDGWGCWSGS